MKKKILYMFIFSSLLIGGCQKDFLTKLPLDKLTDETFWTSESNVRTFAWGFYPIYFEGYASGFNFGPYFSRGDVPPKLSDNYAPLAAAPFPTAIPATASSAGWTYTNVRKANIMIDRIKKVPMPEEAVKHWTGVGRFFRGMEYSRLVNRFGDLPYYGSQLLEDTPELYKPRDSRTLVMDSVLADFFYAAENVRLVDNDTGPKGLIVNKNVVLAFMSRLFLFEGTWQKYHGEQAKATKYLEAAKWAANEVMTKGGYSIAPNYRALYSSLDLSGNPEMIMYRQYETAMITHSLMSFSGKEWYQHGASKNAIDSYLSNDGLPISVSLKYRGDKTIQNIMIDRDLRIKDTFVQELRLVGYVSNYSSSGYSQHKFLNEATKDSKEGSSSLNITDAPIIRLGEVLLNYAEASAELGDISQTDLDLSVNKLRSRTNVNMPKLQVLGGQPAVNGVVYNDPDRDSSVSSMLWEIRRERRVELMMDGFRLDDLRRWKKLEYTDIQQNPEVNLGAWISKVEYPNTSAKITGASEGYIIPSVSLRTFSDPRVYLSPLPLDQIKLYKEQGVTLAQNPGW